MRRAWIAVLVVALALFGCGDGDEEADETPAPGPSAANTTIATGGTGAQGHDHGQGAADSDCPAASMSLKITASNTKFDTNCLAGTANQPLTLSYENKDQTTHGLVFLESHTAAEPFFRVEVFTGPKTQSVTIPAQRPGTYAFHCQVHPTAMSGTFVVK
jgi:plastocyanin